MTNDTADVTDERAHLCRLISTSKTELRKAWWWVTASLPLLQFVERQPIFI